MKSLIAVIAALLFSAALAAQVVIKVDLYQVTPEGIAVYLGERQVPLMDDILSALPGIQGMYCQLYIRDYNLNGIPEAPAMLSCIDPEGGQHNLAVETEGMENIHQET